MTINIAEIVQMIPHRYPFLLIDKVLEYKIQESIVGIKNVTINEPQFAGHFPDNPVMPGVLIIEAMAQLSAVLVSKSIGSTANKEVYFMTIESTKFRKKIIPGDTIYIYSAIDQNRSHVWKFTARAEVQGEIAAESKFTAMVKDKTSGY